MLYVLSFLAVLSASLYWIYKKVILAPLYQPGMVASWAQKDPASFDITTGDDQLVSQDPSTGRKFWRMPENVELFYFDPQQSKTSSHSSTTPILAIHGGPSIPPQKPWELCAQVPDHDIYLYHARGCGHSTRIFLEFPSKGMWPGMKTLEQTLGIGAQVADIERIRRRLLTDGGKIDLVGHSFGGFIATMYAVEFPSHVRSLTLLAPASVLTLPPPKGIPDFFSLVGDKIRQRGNAQHIADFEVFLKDYMDFASLPQQTDESLAKRQNNFARHYNRAEGGNDDDVDYRVPDGMTGGMACYADFLSLGMEHDYTLVCQKLLSNSSFPVSIVHGADDLMPDVASRQYEKLFPLAANVHFEVIPDVAHDIFDHPRAAKIVGETMARAASAVNEQGS